VYRIPILCMEKKIPDLLQHAHNMIEEGKLSETLEFLKSSKPIDNYTEREKTIFYTLTSKIHYYLGNYSEAYEIAEKGMYFAKRSERGLDVVDSFLNMIQCLRVNNKPMESMNLLEESSEILKNLTKISEEDHKQRMGLIY